MPVVGTMPCLKCPIPLVEVRLAFVTYRATLNLPPFRLDNSLVRNVSPGSSLHPPINSVVLFSTYPL